MMMLIEVPESVLFAEMSDALQKQIAKINGQFVEAMLIGTQAVDGKKLIFVSVDATPEQVEYLTNNEVFDPETNEQLAFNLGWTVVASEDTQIDQDLLLPYFKDELTFDEDGEVNGTQPITDLTGKIQTWAGKQWVY